MPLFLTTLSFPFIVSFPTLVVVRATPRVRSARHYTGLVSVVFPLLFPYASFDYPSVDRNSRKSSGCSKFTSSPTVQFVPDDLTAWSIRQDSPSLGIPLLGGVGPSPPPPPHHPNSTQRVSSFLTVPEHRHGLNFFSDGYLAPPFRSLVSIMGTGIRKQNTVGLHYR